MDDDDDDYGALASRSGAYWVSRARGRMGGRDWRKKRFLLFPYSRVNWSGEVQTRWLLVAASSGSSGNGPDDAIMLTRPSRRRCVRWYWLLLLFFLIANGPSLWSYMSIFFLFFVAFLLDLMPDVNQGYWRKFSRIDVFLNVKSKGLQARKGNLEGILKEACLNLWAVTHWWFTRCLPVDRRNSDNQNSESNIHNVIFVLSISEFKVVFRL